MPKLLTPVQYEPSLEGLNAVRPLQLADEVKQIISYPVLCKNPPTANRPAIGKLARCDRAGALLSDKPRVFTAYEYITQDFEVGDSEHLIQFSQKVWFAESLVIAVGLWSAAYWTDPTYTLEIKDIYDTYPVFLPFAGTDLYVTVTCMIPGFVTTLGFLGFY